MRNMALTGTMKSRKEVYGKAKISMRFHLGNTIVGIT
jgi:hypothetical protein